MGAADRRRAERRNHKLMRGTSRMAIEHRRRRAGWRHVDGWVELWFSLCDGDDHGQYWATCDRCNIGHWVRTETRWPPAAVVALDDYRKAKPGTSRP